MSEIVMPRLSDSMEEGTILTWMKSVGDEISIGDELVEIETDKANMAYESDVAGTLTAILAEEGATLPIGSPIAVIGDPAEGPSGQPAGPVGAGDPPPPAVAKASSGVVPPTPPPAGEADESSEGSDAGDAAPADGERVKASPLARRLAKERGVDLSSIAGSGPSGRVVKADVEAAASPTPTQPEGVGDAAAEAPAEQPETAKGTVTVEELSKLQQVVARRMSESKATAPHFYLETEIDMTAAVEGRKRLKELAGEGEAVPTFNDMVVKACALALKEFPRANGSYKDGKFELYSRVNIGVAVAAQDALVVPTVFDADKKGLREISADTKRLASRVRDAAITPPELSGGTFTVSNLGMFGITNFSAVINTPQAGILAVGALGPKPVVDGSGEVVVRQIMGVTLACDHRILYGADGAQFLARIRALLEEPISLAL
jgi:pyruvate dehydrogenase E2 component (dihydrolipoamide acetyltransferase)